MTATYRPRRLRRALGVAPLLDVDAGPAGTWDDDTTAKLTIRRGDTSTFGGVLPSTCTLDAIGSPPTTQDQTLTVNLTGPAAAWLATLTGRTAATLRHRWAGRIAKQTVTDAGPDAARRTTKLTGSHWAAQATLADTPVSVTSAHRSVATMWHNLWDALNLPTGGLNVDNSGAQLLVTGDNVGVDYMPADVIEKYGADIGHIVRTRRSGVVDVIGTGTGGGAGPGLTTRAYRWDHHTPRAITRAQALAPATWEQPATSPGRVSYKYRDPDHENQFYTNTLTVGWPSGRPVREPEHDTTNVWDRDTAPDSALWVMMLGRANRAAGLYYNLPTLTFDLLSLIDSDHVADHQLAGDLLALEHFDAIRLADDWPADVAGVAFATSITETITPDAWTITLGLQRLEYVTGQHSGDIYPSAATWHNAYPPTTTWADTTNTWAGTPTTD